MGFLSAARRFFFRALARQHQLTAFELGLSGFVVFAFTDEWHTGGAEITEWAFGQSKTNFASFHAEMIGPLQQVFSETIRKLGETAADAHRLNAMPKLALDMTRIPDHLFSGPDLPVDETVRARFFGEA